MGFWQEYRTVSRFEFLPATSVAILIGIFLAASSFEELRQAQVLITTLVGLVVFVLLFNVGFQCNCWADWEVDQTYKTHLADSVQAMGRDRLLAVWVGHLAAAVGLTVALAVTYSRWDLLLLVLLGTFFGVFYSIPPLRFKARGPWHAVMAFPVFTVPGAFAYLLVRPLDPTSTLGLAFVLVLSGITLAHYGLVLVSQCEDLPDDRGAGIVTPPVAYGLQATLRGALVLSAKGNALAGVGLALFLADTHPLLLLGGVIVLTGAYSVPLRMLLRLNVSARSGHKEKALLKEIRSVMKDYPKFHGAPLAATMVVALLRVVVLSMEWQRSLLPLPF